jgi:hypothetical protein
VIPGLAARYYGNAVSLNSNNSGSTTKLRYYYYHHHHHYDDAVVLYSKTFILNASTFNGLAADC